MAGQELGERPGALARGGVSRPVAVAVVLAAELLILAFGYQVFATFDCQGSGAYWTCRGLRSLVARGLAVFALAALVMRARGAGFAAFRAEARQPVPVWAVAANLAGFALILLPLLTAGGRDMAAAFPRLLVLWLPGAALATLGGIFWMAPLRAWRAWAAADGRYLALALGIGALMPDLANLILPFWNSATLASATFATVGAILAAAGETVTTDPGAYIVTVQGFSVRIAEQCSGIEGIALVAGFAALYVALFRENLRLKRFLFVALPLALLLSWAMNALRIAVLVLIGAHVSPDLAVNGFHSYAGWVFFTALALALIALAEASPWLRHGAEGPGLLEDPAAPLILPFVVFMLAGTAAPLLIHPEGLSYPVKTLALLAVLWPFRAQVRALFAAPSALPVLAGLAVGLGWQWTAPPHADAELAAALAGLPLALALLWWVARVLGTVVLVPVVEELFFRGYLLTRIDRGGAVWRALAVLVSSLAFAVLHGRPAAAFLAGLVFAGLALWRGRTGDAVLAHVAANGWLALVAIWAQDPSRF